MWLLPEDWMAEGMLFMMARVGEVIWQWGSVPCLVLVAREPIALVYSLLFVLIRRECDWTRYYYLVKLRSIHVLTNHILGQCLKGSGLRE